MRKIDKIIQFSDILSSANMYMYFGVNFTLFAQCEIIDAYL